MYVVTFYSFKGGVGRTMALVNVGFHLASTGRRVLLVDFDLEAPALDTFDLLKPRGKSRGVVDYFTNFCEANESPDVGDYLYEVIGAGGDGGRLWVMPAGLRDGRYSSRLRALDWGDMYKNREGSLAVEDLRAQWNRKELSPDYVLIDSRTGHCDVGGICTRQLPNAVVAFFFPNDQNLIGLKKVVFDIRREKNSPREGETEIHFVTSIIPRIDDEKGDLRKRLKECQSELGYVRDPLVIHTYDSLAFVNQTVFTVERSGTSLAKEYRKLADTIAERNPEDRKGALRLLQRMGLPHADPKEERDQLTEIANKHSGDGEILFYVAMAHQRSASDADVFTYLDRAIEAGHKTAEAFIRRADVRARLTDDGPRIIQDVRSALDCDSIEIWDARRAIQLMRQYDQNVGEIGDRKSIRALSPVDKDRLAIDMLWDIETARVATEILFGALRDPDCDDDLRQTIREGNLSLALIATQRFKDAMVQISTIRPQPEDLDLQGAFNYAMAGWGATGELPIPFFRQVVELDDPSSRHRGGNYHQCIALAHWAIDNKNEAIERLADARRKASVEEFSCWRYLQVN